MNGIKKGILKKGSSLLTIFLLGILVIQSAFAQLVPRDMVQIQITELKLDDTALYLYNSNLDPATDYERGKEYSGKITFLANADAKDVELEVFIAGYEYNDRDRISFVSEPFDVVAGVQYTKRFTLKIPENIKLGNYALRVRFSDRDSLPAMFDYRLKIGTSRHQIDIKDVLLNPENAVLSGRSLLASVRLENNGERDERNVKVKVSIPSLGLSSTDYIDEIRSDEELSSEELFLRIPKCATPAEYDVIVSVEYDEGYEKEVKTDKIAVLDGGLCEEQNNNVLEKTNTDKGKTIITLGAASQDVTAGDTALFPLTLTNTGSESKTYTIEVEAGSWGKSKIMPSNVLVLDSGKSEALTIYVESKKDALPGEKLVGVTIKSGDDILKTFALKANVLQKESSSNLKRALEIGLIVLIVLLVIIGLIIGLNRLREDDDENEGQTYY